MKFTEPFGQLQEWQVLKREPVLECPPWLSLWRETIRLPDGREIDDYYQLEQRDYVEIVAWQNGKVFGLWRYKHGPRRVNLGLPAGYLENGEDALAAAHRELSRRSGIGFGELEISWFLLCRRESRPGTCAYLCCSQLPECQSTSFRRF